LVRLAKGREVWSIDYLCIYCRRNIGPDEDVYVIGAHVFHVECLEHLLSRPQHEFEEVRKRMPLDTKEELRRLYEERRGLPKPAPTPPAPPAPPKQPVPPAPGDVRRELEDTLYKAFIKLRNVIADYVSLLEDVFELELITSFRLADLWRGISLAKVPERALEKARKMVEEGLLDSETLRVLEQGIRQAEDAVKRRDLEDLYKASDKFRHVKIRIEESINQALRDARHELEGKLTSILSRPFR